MPSRTEALIRSFRTAVVISMLCGAAVGASGCRQGAAKEEFGPNPALRAIQTPAGGTKADADRAVLARIVGVWRFDGWSIGSDGAKIQAAGTAAGTIENEHFVLLDVQSSSGQLGGRAARKGGSMLFASEPEAGLTLTAWGDASPAVRRLNGEVRGNGSALTFADRRGADVSLKLVFTTDDRWVLEAVEPDGRGTRTVARYVFERVTR